MLPEGVEKGGMRMGVEADRGIDKKAFLTFYLL